MWKKEFWLATLERMIRAGAAATVSVLVVGGSMTDAFDVNIKNLVGIFLGAALVSLLLALAGNGLSGGTGPAFGPQEVVEPVPPNEGGMIDRTWLIIIAVILGIIAVILLFNVRADARDTGWDCKGCKSIHGLP